MRALTVAAVTVTTLLLAVRVARAAPPPPPSGVNATLASSSQINLSWTAVPGASAYRVLRGTVSGGPYSPVGMSSAPNFANVGLALGKTYYYVVQAYKGAFSANSAQVSATTGSSPAPQVPPSPPSNVTAVAGSGTIDLAWAASTGAAVYRYEIVRSVTPGGTTAVDAVAGNVTAYADASAGSSAGLYYRIRAVGAYGSSLSAELFVPGAPLLSATSQSDVRIDLSWTPSVGATSYDVYRSTSSGGPFTTPHASVPTPGYQDGTLSPDATYYYVVRAVAAGGAGSGSSILSNVASATTAPAPPALSAGAITASSIQLTWSPSPGATIYRVFTGPDGGPYATELPDSPTSATTVTHSGLSPGTTYFYVIRAVGPNGTSRDSAPFSAMTAAPPRTGRTRRAWPGPGTASPSSRARTDGSTRWVASRTGSRSRLTRPPRTRGPPWRR